MTRILPAGERASLVDFDSEAGVLAFTEALTRNTPVGVEDFLPAARTVLVTCTPAADLTYVRKRLNDLEQTDSAATTDEHFETDALTIAVRYDGPDLDDVAQSLGMSRSEVVAAHTGAMWRCASSDSHPASLPDFRRHSARRSASNAITNRCACRFRRPGRWIQRGLPACITGWLADHREHRCRDVGSERHTTGHRSSRQTRALRERGTTMNSLEILDTGPLSLIQDLGRIGHLRSGVGVSGAADRRSLRLGNRLVGNNEGAAGVEVLLGGLSLRAQQPTTIAFTGAPAQAYRDGIPVGHSSVIDLRAGQTVRLDYAPSGLRTYLTVRGGIVVPEILGSRSTDTMSGIGPAPLEPGVFLPIGPSPTTFSAVDLAPVPPMANETLAIRVVFGPRADRFTNPKHSSMADGRSRPTRTESAHASIASAPTNYFEEQTTPNCPPKA